MEKDLFNKAEIGTYDLQGIGSVSLRQLTEKSLMRFGKYIHHTVGDLLKMGEEGHSYLRWVYFHCEQITFHVDILEQIGISLEWRIEKPGKCSIRNKSLKRSIRESMSPEERDKFLKEMYREIRIQKKGLSRVDNYRFSKEQMRKRNHGNV